MCIFIVAFDVFTHRSKKKKKKVTNFSASMDGPGDYYVKCNKPVSERQIPYAFAYICGI